MPSINQIEEHRYTFPILLSYAIMTSSCLFYWWCKGCCKTKLASTLFPKITLSSGA